MKSFSAVLFASKPGLDPAGDLRSRQGSTTVRAELVEAFFASAVQGVPASRATPGLVANHRSFDKLSPNGVPWVAGATPGQQTQANHLPLIKQAAQAQPSPTDTQ